MRSRALLLGTALAAGVGGCYRKPSAAFDGLEIAGFGLRQLDLVVRLKVSNPNGFALHMTSLTYALTADGIEIASGAAPRPMPPLAARADTIVRAPVSVRYLNLLPVLNRARGAESIAFDFAGQASFSVLGWKVPVRIRRVGRIPPLRQIGWRFRGARYVRGRPAWMELSFEVTNPNRFAVPLRRLHGALKYGDDILLRVDEPKLRTVPAGGSAAFTVKVRLDGVGVATALARALAEPKRRRFSFDGQLRAGVPEVLRKMLLSRQGQEDRGRARQAHRLRGRLPAPVSRPAVAERPAFVDDDDGPAGHFPPRRAP